jgi:Di-haem cytochrome c peroxidase
MCRKRRKQWSINPSNAKRTPGQQGWTTRRDELAETVTPLSYNVRDYAKLFCVALLGLWGALIGVTLLLYDYAHADVLGGLLPAPRMPRDIIPLTPVEKLGKLMLYDSTLSNPQGYACATCHVLETGFTGPNSEINAFSGPQPGVVPGRFSDRKPQSYLYAAFSPEGPYFDSGLWTWLGGNFWDGRVSDLAKQGLQPPINPNEMANTPEGPYTPANGWIFTAPRSEAREPVIYPG